ncbi:LysM repeat-containing protein, partial [Facklamia miroungae]
MRHKTIKTSLLSISMSVLATVAVTHLNSVPSVYAQESNYSIGTYTVKAGDGVYRIAMNHGMTMEDLKQLNGLTSNLIHPGDILKVYLKENTATENQPVKEESESQASNNASTPVDDQTEVPSQPTTPSKPTTNKTYTVRPGDWLGKIAGQYGITVNQLKAWNNL